MRKFTALAGATAILVTTGWGAAAFANAGDTHDSSHGWGTNCPRGFVNRAVPVSGFTLWTCAKPTQTGPGATATVTATVTVTAPAVTVTGPTVTVTVTKPNTTTTTTVTAPAPLPTVVAGEACSPVGLKGVTAAGVAMVCTLKPNDKLAHWAAS